MSQETQNHLSIVRKTKKPSLDNTVKEMIMTLSDESEVAEYELSQEALSKRHQGKVLAFPYWRRHQKQAERVLALQQSVPWLKYLPLRLSCVLADVFMR